LSYSGQLANDQLIDFYDISEALVGFQRSLALTTQVVLDGKVIIQAPALRGAKILALPPEPGSWKIKATIIVAAAGLYHIGTVPRDTPLGNLISFFLNSSNC
jgi:hypothetical protein